jgi:hypothetical protein
MIYIFNHVLTYAVIESMIYNDDSLSEDVIKGVNHGHDYSISEDVIKDVNHEHDDRYCNRKKLSHSSEKCSIII